MEEDFTFFGRSLSGQKEIEPRWKRCVQATDGALGEILGRLYVERAFGGDSKPVALEMIEGIEAALGRIEDGTYEFRASPVEPGDHFAMRAEMDAIVVVSACPDDAPYNAGRPKPLRLEVWS